jgi:hypothetical protein
MDSGANISITNPQIVAKINLTPQRWERSFHINFGNGGRFACTHYADFGPILGRIAIVDEAPDTLLSIAVLTDRGYEVRFLAEGQGVHIYSKGQLLLKGPQHPHTKLFHIDIQSLIHPPPDYEPDLSALKLNTDKEQPEPPEKVVHRAALDLTTARDVLWLHKRMGHPSRATMYQSIMNGTWTGLPPNITPAQVNKTLKNIHCLSCELSKRNRDPTKEGDGFHAPSPGDEISVDYQGKINPPSIRGFTGFYLLKDSYSGHRHAIMVKNKSAASYLDALQRVITFYNSHGHTVRRLRCDAGSTEADAEVIEHLPPITRSSWTLQESASKARIRWREKSRHSSKESALYSTTRRP